MPPSILQTRVAQLAQAHCARLGYESGPNWNPLEPQNPVAALAMARLLVESAAFDAYVAVAPEGHAYGFFFARLGVHVQSVFVDYPPRQVTGIESLAGISGSRVLILEDDVCSGVSLELVVSGLQVLAPKSLSLYLGREAESQQQQNIPQEIEQVFVAESHLQAELWPEYEADFSRTFAELE